LNGATDLIDRVVVSNAGPIFNYSFFGRRRTNINNSHVFFALRSRIEPKDERVDLKSTIPTAVANSANGDSDISRGGVAVFSIGCPRHLYPSQRIVRSPNDDWDQAQKKYCQQNYPVGIFDWHHAWVKDRGSSKKQINTAEKRGNPKFGRRQVEHLASRRRHKTPHRLHQSDLGRSLLTD
jgi:hypothetical protein